VATVVVAAAILGTLYLYKIPRWKRKILKEKEVKATKD
jgi:hypothetical protein